MNVDTLLENFDVLAEADDGIELLRKLILSLGTRVGFENDLNKCPKYKLSEVSVVSWGNLSLTKTSYIENGQFLAVSAAGPDGRIDEVEHDEFTPVISAIGARCGTMFMPDEKFTAIKNTMTVTPNRKKIDNWYLFYALRGSILPRRGTAQPFLSKKDIENFEIIVPSSLEEQQLIVAKINEFLALCDQLEKQQKQRDNLRTATRKSAIDAISTATTPAELEAAWKRINNNWEVIADTPESVASLRTLILNLAVRGQLTNTLGNAKRREESFKELGSVLTLEYGKPLDKSLRTGKGSIPVYGANGVKAMTAQSLVKERGIVVGRKGSAGEVNMTEGPFWPLDVTFFAKFDHKIFDLKYLYYLLKSLNLPQMARGIKPGINRNDVNKLKVLSVDLVEQKRIVAKVDELMALCDQLESDLKSRSVLAEKFARSVVSAA